MKLTPTEKRIVDLLSDGQAHSQQELVTCLPDELSDKAALGVHLTFLRKKLRTVGRAIRTEITEKMVDYRMVRVISRD